MDLNAYAKQIAIGVADKFKNIKERAGLGIRHAAGQIGEDVARGAGILNDPRNAWIGMNPVGRMGAEGMGLVSALLGQVAYHGSPHKFEKFLAEKIGTGEGKQAYGHGIYFAENPIVARGYRSNLTDNHIDKIKRLQIQEEIDSIMSREEAARGKGDHIAADAFLSQATKLSDQLDSVSKPGALYKVDIPDEAIGKMLDWDKPLDKQPENVRAAVLSILKPNADGTYTAPSGAKIDLSRHTGQSIVEELGTGERGAGILKSLGVPGIKYLDGGSRGAGSNKGTYNFVVFDESLPKILERE